MDFAPNSRDNSFPVQGDVMTKQLLADAKRMGLTPKQIAEAKRKGVKTIIGLRIIEKNSRGRT
jgi:hypothetical protein